MASAFIIQVQPQLQPDPNEESAALLRVLIHKIDNTTFGDDVPKVPQWSGPPRTIVQVQAILYASLAASLLSAFLGFFRQQLLSRYAANNIRGSIIERCQLRQWKFDGLIAWRFDITIELSSLVLQIALLLLCRGLSLYLWDINTMVATVFLSVISFSALLYIFITCAGVISVNSPYQNPLGLSIRSFVGSALWGQPDVLRGSVDARKTILDLRCILWMLCTSLDKYVHLLALKFLAATPMTHFDHGLLSTCVDILIGCVSTFGDRLTVTEGLEELTEASALCPIHGLSYLATMDPESTVFDDVQQRYITIFPSKANFEGFQPYYFSVLHNVFHPRARSKIQWKDYDPFSIGRVAISNLARYRYQRAQPQKVPRWTLHFALHYLSQDPLPPLSVMVDCLSVVAIDLGCTVLSTTTQHERCVYT